MRLRFFQFSLRQLLLLMTTVAAVCAIIPCVSSFLLTGSPIPIRKIETLNNPSGVKGWDSNGLILQDGRKITVPGIRALPQKSDALAEITRRGIEIAVDGKVYGLVQIHHWCGNDPVRVHIVRVDVSELLAFLRVGELVSPDGNQAFSARTPGGSFSQFGWNISEYYGFDMWRMTRDLPDELTTSKTSQQTGD